MTDLFLSLTEVYRTVFTARHSSPWRESLSMNVVTLVEGVFVAQLSCDSHIYEQHPEFLKPSETGYRFDGLGSSKVQHHVPIYHG